MKFTLDEAEAREQFYAAYDALWIQSRLLWWGFKEYVWRAIPHRHVYSVRQWCDRCGRSDFERLNK